MDYERLLKQLVQDEGLRFKPYKCTGDKWTVFVGRNFEDRPFTVEETRWILEEGPTEAVAMRICRNDVAVCEREMDRAIPWWRSLSPLRQEVLVNMCFNLGWPRLSQFRKMMAALQRGDFEAAAVEMMDSRWATQVGARARRLREMMRRG